MHRSYDTIHKQEQQEQQYFYRQLYAIEIQS